MVIYLAIAAGLVSLSIVIRVIRLALALVLVALAAELADPGSVAHLVHLL